MTSSQSNSNLRLPGSYLARSYLIATLKNREFDSILSSMSSRWSYTLDFWINVGYVYQSKGVCLYGMSLFGPDLALSWILPSWLAEQYSKQSLMWTSQRLHSYLKFLRICYLFNRIGYPLSSRKKGLFIWRAIFIW